MQERIELWSNIYKGKLSWLDYEYVPLTGRKVKRTRASLKAGKVVSSELSNLIWGEQPEYKADKDVLTVLEQNNFAKKIRQYTEYMCAMGGMALKIYSKDNQIKIDYVTALNFLPKTWNNNTVTEADFYDRTVVKNIEYLRVEKHRITEGGYNIEQEVFKCVKGDKPIKCSASVLGMDDAPVFIETDRPLFVYITTPEANNYDFDSPLGISMYSNAEDTLKALDIAFDALQQEIVLGRKRIIVPAESVRQVIGEDGKPQRYFDPADEIFQAFGSEDIANLKISDNSVELRIEEIKTAIQTLLNILSIQVGFSAGYLSFDGVSVKTATEIISENSKTFQTKQNYEENLGSGIEQLMESIRTLLTGRSGEPYQVLWNDSVIEDRNSKTDYWTRRYQAGTVSLERYLSIVDKMTPDEIKAEIERIKNDKATIDTDSLFGMSE